MRFVISLLLLWLLGINFGWGQSHENVLSDTTRDSVLAQVDLLLQSNRFEESRALLRQNLDQVDPEVDPAFFARLQFNRVHSYYFEQRFPKGIRVGKEVLSLLSYDVPEHCNALASTHNCLNAMYFREGAGDKMLYHSRKTLMLVNRCQLSDPVRINALADLGICFRELRNLDSARYYMELAYRTAEQSDQITDRVKAELLVDISDHLSHLYYSYLDLPDQGVRLLNNAIQYGNTTLGPDHHLLVPLYINLSHLYGVLGEQELATDYVLKAIEIGKKGSSDGRTKVYYFEALIMGANMLREQQQYTSALAYFEEAANFVSPDTTFLSDKINLLKNTALLQLYLGNYDKSQSLMTQSEELEQQLPPLDQCRGEVLYPYFGALTSDLTYARERGDYQRIVRVCHKILNIHLDQFTLSRAMGAYELSDLYQKNGLLDSALFYNQLALNIASAQSNATPWPTLPSARTVRDYHYEYEILQQRLDLMEGVVQLFTNSDERLRHQLAVIDLVDTLHVQNLRKINLMRGTQSRNLIRTSLPFYRMGVGLAQRGAASDRAFYYSQKLKAQQLWMSWLSSQASVQGNLSSSLMERERTLRMKINGYEQQVRDAQDAEDPETAEALQLNELFATRRAYNDLMREMEQQYPRYYAAKYNFVPETPEGLQSLLSENELLVEYVIAEDEMFIFTIDRSEGLQLQKIPLWENTTNDIEALHRLLQQSPLIRQRGRERFLLLSHRMYQQFIAPIAAKVAEHSRLIIIGDGLTNYLPFEVLISDQTMRPLTELPYLLRQTAISYHYSTTLFANARRKPQTDARGLYAFAPVYDQDQFPTDDLMSNTQQRSAEAHPTLRAIDVDGRFSPLPESEFEVKSIAALFPERVAQIALRDEATETLLRRALETEQRFVHLAGHSFADLDHPKFSGIACFDQATTDSRTADGILHVGEIYNLSTKADLVTLSSCESGYGKLESTEGLLGLNRAFVYTGTPNVTFSLWKVYDKVSAQLMVEYYREILARDNYAEALRAAKLQLIEDETTASPHYWGAYLLIGR